MEIVQLQKISRIMKWPLLASVIYSYIRQLPIDLPEIPQPCTYELSLLSVCTYLRGCIIIILLISDADHPLYHSSLASLGSATHVFLDPFGS